MVGCCCEYGMDVLITRVADCVPSCDDEVKVLNREPNIRLPLDFPPDVLVFRGRSPLPLPAAPVFPPWGSEEAPEEREAAVAMVG